MLTLLDIDATPDRIGSPPLSGPTYWDPLTRGVQIEPEIVLPMQFAELRRNAAARPAEHALMLAVLEEAVRTYQLGCDSPSLGKRRLAREAEQWFASDETASPFSFVTICQVWNLDPDWVRTGVRRWRGRRDPGSPAMPIRIRRVSGSRHQVTVSRAACRRR
jgi:hypothetical protein